MRWGFCAAGLMLLGLTACAHDSLSISRSPDDIGADPSRTIVLLSPGDFATSGGRVARIDKLTSAELDEHLLALESIWAPSVARVEELMRLAPYVARYEIIDGKPVCPYVRFLKLTLRWTSVDDRNTYWSGPPDVPRRRFALEEWTQKTNWPAEEFQRDWSGSLPRVAEDIQYIQQWYDRRKGHLISGPLFRYHPDATPAFKRSLATAQLRLELIHSVVYDPRYDPCDYKAYLHDEFGIGDSTSPSQ